MLHGNKTSWTYVKCVVQWVLTILRSLQQSGYWPCTSCSLDRLLPSVSSTAPSPVLLSSSWSSERSLWSVCEKGDLKKCTYWKSWERSPICWFAPPNTCSSHSWADRSLVVNFAQVSWPVHISVRARSRAEPDWNLSPPVGGVGSIGTATRNTCLPIEYFP